MSEPHERKKGGAAPLPPEQHRKQFDVRYNPAELALIKQAAAQAGLSARVWLRWRSLQIARTDTGGMGGLLSVESQIHAAQYRVLGAARRVATAFRENDLRRLVEYAADLDATVRALDLVRAEPPQEAPNGPQ